MDELMQQGQAPQDPAAAAPITPEHRQELQKLLGAVKQEYSKWNSMKFSMGNRADAARMDQLKTVFHMFAAHGIDLRDPKSVSAFLAQLKQQDPKQYEAMAKALDYLLGVNDYENGDQSEGTSDQQATPSPEAAV